MQGRTSKKVFHTILETFDGSLIINNLTQKQTKNSMNKRRKEIETKTCIIYEEN